MLFKIRGSCLEYLPVFIDIHAIHTILTFLGKNAGVSKDCFNILVEGEKVPRLIEGGGVSKINLGDFFFYIHVCRTSILFFQHYFRPSLLECIQLESLDLNKT